jgi:hypothetical protein
MTALLEHKYNIGAALNKAAPMKEVGITSKDLVVPNDAPAPFLNRRSNRQKIVVTTVQNKCETLVSDAEQASRSRDASAGIFKGLSDQATFIAKHFRVEGETWRHRGLRDTCCYIGGCPRFNCSQFCGKHSSRTFTQTSSDASVL